MKLKTQGSSNRSKCSWTEHEIIQSKKGPHKIERAQINETGNRNIVVVWENQIDDFAMFFHMVNPLRDQRSKIWRLNYHLYWW